MQKGLRSLLRGTRSRQGRRRMAPLFWCAVAASVLTMPAAAQPPKPDQPPPGSREAAPTTLEPDAPVRAVPTVPTSPPAPPDRAVDTPQPQSEPPFPTVVTTLEAQPAGRHFARSKSQRRWPPVVETPTARTISLSSTVYEPNSRPYVLAALCLAVFVLGSGTLLTVLARLRPTRERVA